MELAIVAADQKETSWQNSICWLFVIFGLVVALY